MWESSGAGEVENIYDPHEDKTYVYHYDEFNNITGYEIKKGNSTSGSNFLTVEASGENDTIYKIDSDLYLSTIYHDEDKLFNPRVSIINNVNAYALEVTYDYDKLGRIVSKKQKVSKFGDFSYSTTITEEIQYKSIAILGSPTKQATLLKAAIVTVIDNKINKNTAYFQDFTYDTRGNLKTRLLTQTHGDSTFTESSTYSYDKANRLITEKRLRNGQVILDYSQ